MKRTQYIAIVLLVGCRPVQVVNCAHEPKAVVVEPDRIRVDERICPLDDVTRWVLERCGVEVERDGNDWIIDRGDGARLNEALRDGFQAVRRSMSVIADNMANLDTTSVSSVAWEGGRIHQPYVCRVFDLQTGAAVEDRKSDLRRVYDPDHPHAVSDPDSPDFGFVLFPNVDPMIETVDMISHTRSMELLMILLARLESDPQPQTAQPINR